MTVSNAADNQSNDGELYHGLCPDFPPKGAPPVVYVIGRQQSSIAKIGFTSRDPRKRLGGIQTGSPVKLEVLWWFFGSFEDEQRLHEEFSHCRLESEWFDFQDEEPDILVKCAAMRLWPERFSEFDAPTGCHPGS